MFQIQLAVEPHGRLVATLSAGQVQAVVTAVDAAEALADLAGALDALQSSGVGESYWQEGQGEYRWLFRRVEEGRVRMVVLWSAGVVTGWEHVFEAACELQELVARMNGEFHRVEALR